jgi:hypothetical protein
MPRIPVVVDRMKRTVRSKDNGRETRGLPGCQDIDRERKPIMTYSFVCPLPCNRGIWVDAKNSLDAVDKMLRAGAMGCRNIESRCVCEEARFELNPIPKEQLNHLVGLCLREV